MGFLLHPRYAARRYSWTHAGAHLLLQTRCKTINRELAATFRRWYPDFATNESSEATTTEMAAAA